MQVFDIHQPTTPDAVCSCLREYEDQAVIHAGGTDLLVRLRAGLLHPAHVIDLSKVPSLRSIKGLPDGGVRIGSMATLADVSTFPGLSTTYQSLHEALESIGSLQIRNRGTLVGNICNASPAADSLPPLLIFDCTVNVRGSSGVRTMRIGDLITGPGETSLAHDEFVVSIDLPHPVSTSSSAYIKIGRRKAVDCSIVGVAVRLGSDGDVRAAFGAVAAKPMRIGSVEKMLSGQKWDSVFINQAVELVKGAVQPIDDIRASKEYRRDMSAVLFKRALNLARERLTSPV